MYCYKESKQKKENKCLVATDVSQLARAKEYIDHCNKNKNAAQRVSHDRRIEHLLYMKHFWIRANDRFIHWNDPLRKSRTLYFVFFDVQ